MMKKISFRGIEFILPPGLSVKSKLPNFYAENKSGSVTFVFDLKFDNESYFESLSMLRENFGVNEMLKSTIIREGEVSSPVIGYEKIIHHRIVNNLNDPGNHSWALALSHNNFSIFIELNAEGSYESMRDYWEKIVDSIKIS
ncbi:hypothetical protein [Cerasicoccus fimbriatus]|uniref:hypothetical protein n=1 Tax=Cerasicoccus fimbriatus TaxID=3014554 RepID=UPI0022B318BB|nr:hypothetical protein [Cerasicoccus sp. TK19100]